MSATDIFVCTRRAANNLAFQGNSVVENVVKELATFKGADILGAKIKVPLSKYPEVYVLPMFTIKAGKTTGICIVLEVSSLFVGVVTSVPSDSPDDYAAYRDLKNKKDAMFEKYGKCSTLCAPDVL